MTWPFYSYLYFFRIILTVRSEYLHVFIIYLFYLYQRIVHVLCIHSFRKILVVRRECLHVFIICLIYHYQRIVYVLKNYRITLCLCQIAMFEKCLVFRVKIGTLLLTNRYPSELLICMIPYFYNGSTTKQSTVKIKGYSKFMKVT